MQNTRCGTSVAELIQALALHQQFVDGGISERKYQNDLRKFSCQTLLELRAIFNFRSKAYP